MNEPCDHYEVRNYDRFDICEKCGIKWYASLNPEPEYDEVDDDE